MSLAPSPELTVLGLAAILQAGQIGLAAWSMNRDGMSKWNAGPRDGGGAHVFLAGCEQPPRLSPGD